MTDAIARPSVGGGANQNPAYTDWECYPVSCDATGPVFLNSHRVDDTLFDIGAGPSLIRRTHLPPNCLPRPVYAPLSCANTASFPVHSAVWLSLTLPHSQHRCLHRFFVADQLSHACILGRDILWQRLLINPLPTDSRPLSSWQVPAVEAPAPPIPPTLQCDQCRRDFRHPHSLGQHVSAVHQAWPPPRPLRSVRLQTPPGMWSPSPANHEGVADGLSGTTPPAMDDAANTIASSDDIPPNVQAARDGYSEWYANTYIHTHTHTLKALPNPHTWDARLTTAG